MDKRIEALRLAIEALENSLTRFNTYNELQHEAIQACIDALESQTNPEFDVVYHNVKQPAQEPVAIVTGGDETWIDADTINNVIIPVGTKLYTHPAPSWQGLSDDEIVWLQAEHDIDSGLTEHSVNDFARAIEQALKEKNNG